MTEVNPTSLFFHFQRTGSDVIDTLETNVGGLLLGLRLQRTTKTTANARRRNLPTLALALARRSRCETFFFLRVMGQDQPTSPPSLDTIQPNRT